jgi:hypothetical protein
MNVLKEIEAQINSIKKIDSSTYLDSIFAHIERAEFYYNSGMTDSNFFNDVIYRSNQAYEGALKESYKVLAEKTADEVIRKTPNDIERFFETESIFKERVLQLFKNYRQEWRNKSTHDYKLFFDESEAFIALTSVSSFVHLLLKQIQEKTVYTAQQRKLEAEPIIEKITEPDSVASNLDILASVISGFAKEATIDYGDISLLREAEIAGALHAYLEHNSSGIFVVRREVRLESREYIFIADFVIEFADEKFILELKRSRERKYDVDLGVNQVFQYLDASGITQGILYYANAVTEGHELDIIEVERKINEIDYRVVVIGM